MRTRILVVDDNPAVRIALRQLLESTGHGEIIEVENGQEAVAKAQELKPSLIILDLVMPVMDGLTAARELSKLLPNIPLLMHTLHWSQQMEIEAQKVGARKVVPKGDRKGLIAGSASRRSRPNIGDRPGKSGPARNYGPAADHRFRFSGARGR